MKSKKTQVGSCAILLLNSNILHMIVHSVMYNFYICIRRTLYIFIDLFSEFNCCLMQYCSESWLCHCQ